MHKNGNIETVTECIITNQTIDKKKTSMEY